MPKKQKREFTKAQRRLLRKKMRQYGVGIDDVQERTVEEGMNNGKGYVYGTCLAVLTTLRRYNTNIIELAITMVQEAKEKKNKRSQELKEKTEALMAL